MSVFNNLSEIPQDNYCLTMGNFDGLHLGHQFLLKRTKDKAKLNNGKVAVLTFSPHPGFLFSPKTFKRLFPESFIVDNYHDFGIETLIFQKFDLCFSKLTAESFLIDYIFKYIKPSQMVLGYDFKFGFNGLGNYHLAKKIASNFNCQVEQVSEFKTNLGETLSSSLIKKSLKDNDWSSLENLLGRNYSLKSHIIKGKQLGRQIGFPTLNLDTTEFKDCLLPCYGVYYGWASFDNHIKYPMITNIGTNPTVNSNDDVKIESHLFNFSKEVYGQKVTLEFLGQIRKEKKFTSVTDLKSQIEKDCLIALERLTKV